MTLAVSSIAIEPIPSMAAASSFGVTALQRSSILDSRETIQIMLVVPLLVEMMMCGLPHEWWARRKTGYCLSKESVMPRRKFTREFKSSAVRLVHEQGYTIAQAAKSLGVDPNSLRNWLEKFTDESGAAPTGDAALKAELQRLRKENARLLIEREILKKAAAFFAKEQP